MPIPSKPSLLRNVIGYDADVFSLPDTTVEGSGALSYESGWPRITGTSLKAGGKAPQREYFNQVNKMLSQHLFFLQSGNVYDWDASLNYNAGAHVLGSDGLEYIAVSPSGPDVPGVGAKDPAGSRNKSQWLLLAALLMSSDGGLVIDPVTGKGSVDFEQMPTDKFEALLKSIRVPIWLTKSKSFYVNGTTGSDVLDEGRGESEAKPFKTIQAAINYVTSNYNINIYVSTIRIADGVYTEDIKLSKYTSTTGVVQLRGNASDRGRVVIKGCIGGGQSLGRWDVQYITIKNKPGATSIGSFNYFGVLSQNGTTIEIFNCAIDVSEAAPEGGIKVPVHAGGGEIQIRTLDGTAGLSVVDDGEGETSRILYGTLAGNIMMAADIDLMNVSVSVAVLFLSNLSVFTLVTSEGGTLPKFTGSATGKRYDVRENSIAAVSGQGPDFIPGTIAGTTSTGGQYT